MWVRGVRRRQGQRKMVVQSLILRRLVKRALPRPVPIVSTPQRCRHPASTGSSLRPCTTASLWMTITVSWPSMSGISCAQQFGEIETAAFPVARQVLAAALDRAVLADHAGAADADERRELQAILFGGGNMLLEHVDQTLDRASSRFGLLVAHAARARSALPRPSRDPAFLAFISTMPTRMLVPPMSTARMLSWPERIHDGTKCAAPMRPASSGSLSDRL